MTSSTPTQRNQMAFGVEPSSHRYRLRLSRYNALSDTIVQYIQSLNTTKAETEPVALLHFLDIGLDEGRSRRWLKAKRVDSFLKFHGVDISAQHLETVEEKEVWTLFQCDAQKTLPFPSEYFDIIICEQVLEHLEKPENAVKEITRVLKKGGICILGVPGFFPGVPLLLYTLAPWYRKLSKKKYSHIQFFSPYSLSALLKKQGVFKIQSLQGTRFISGGFLRPLENYRWFWKLNVCIGKLFPSLCQDIQISAKKIETPSALTP
jgi:ubiquinone/menaquinone biosynthesis C-methylase UbiE